MMKEKFDRQGDIYIYFEEKLPKNLKKVKADIVARGEKTGHCHVLEGDFTSYEDAEGTLWLVVPENSKAELKHVYESSGEIVFEKTKGSDGHKTTILEPGIKRIAQQKAFNPYQKAWERVSD